MPPPAPPPAASAAVKPAAAAATVADAPSGYAKPPSPLLEVMHSPNPPTPILSPLGNRILLASVLEYPSMERVAEPFLKLAGVRVEPKSRAKHDTPGGYGIRPCIRDFTIVTVPAGTETKIALPAGSCPSGPSWSPDGVHFVFSNTLAEAVELWIGDASNGQIHRVGDLKLNPMLGSTVQWMADQKSVLVKLVPDNAGAPPPAPVVPLGPSIQESNGEKGVSSTYETRDTLKDKHDEALFDYYAASQLAVVDTATGTKRLVGKPALYTELDVAPDGAHVIVDQVKRPYSYVTTYDRFPHEVAVWDVTTADGAARKLASLPLSDRVPVHGVPTGPREFNWRQNETATLIWAEALDGGDWKVTVPARDKVMMQKAPFSTPAAEVTRTEQRFEGFVWGTQPSLAFLHEHDENKHWSRTFTIDVDNKTTAKPTLLWDLSSDEHYKDPGRIVMKVLPSGAYVARQEGDTVYLSGGGASPAGDRPFLDRLDVKTKKTERLFRSDKLALESFLGFASQKPAEPGLITWHQSPTDPPNAFLRTVGAATPSAAAEEATFSSSPAAITHMVDPVPAVRAIKKRLVKYKRKDGLELSFTLYTPPSYQEGTRVPAILYAYPQDFADAKKAGQVTGSEQTFTRLKNYRLMLLAGYAIIDNAAFPIVGDPKKAYDTYLDQLTADAKAAVDEAVRLGVVDPDRVGVTGHSHGALMTANLLAHTELFRAGVATSGSYNKTLTPFGFQNERRSVWEAQDVYLKASPFFFADKMKKPILIVHGDDDANPGTTPLQASKLYEAIRGNGGTARLVMLPHEPHWYTAMESNEQLVAEMLTWFDKYVKNAPAKNAAPAAAPKTAAAAR